MKGAELIRWLWRNYYYYYYRECNKSNRDTIIHQLLNTEGRQGEMMERNREHIKVILDVVLTCAKQEIPLRGYRVRQTSE